jgi:hypothetical protein
LCAQLAADVKALLPSGMANSMSLKQLLKVGLLSGQPVEYRKGVRTTLSRPFMTCALAVH